MIFGCGSGASDSGAGENAINNSGDLVGIYTGEESVRLINQSSDLQADAQQNEVSISINGAGLLQLSTTAGTSGTAQITNNRTFSFRADAKTQFNGQCSSGTITLSGSVTQNSVTGSYSSENVVCGGENFRVEGELSASR